MKKFYATLKIQHLLDFFSVNSNMEYVELQNASSFKLDKLLFRIDAIECVQKPIANDVGCIIVIQGQKYQVKESYDYVKSILTK